jgi:hypothetical protein
MKLFYKDKLHLYAKHIAILQEILFLRYYLYSSIKVCFISLQSNYICCCRKMNTSISNEKGKSVLSQISLGGFVAAIVSLGDRSNQLIDETWRLNLKTKSSSSLWGEIINKLGLIIEKMK